MFQPTGDGNGGGGGGTLGNGYHHEGGSGGAHLTVHDHLLRRGSRGRSRDHGGGSNPRVSQQQQEKERASPPCTDFDVAYFHSHAHLGIHEEMIKGTEMGQDKILVVTDQVAVSLGAVLDVIKVAKKEGVEQIDPLIITQASSESLVSVESSSFDDVVSICKSLDFPSDQLLTNFSRVLKPGGTILLHLTSQSSQGQMTNSSLEHKLLLAGFLDIKSSGSQSFGIMGKKPSWKIGSSFSIKKTSQVLPKVQIDDDVDLIDEDSLLTEEDLKKPQLPPDR